MSDLLTQAVRGNRRDVFSRYGERPSYGVKERFVRYTLRTFSYFTVFVTLAIVFILVIDASEFFSQASFLEFITGREWLPFGEPKKLGVLPLLTGTVMIAVGSSLVSIPIGLGIAIFLTQYTSRRFQRFMGPVLEVLGGIPTVVYGFFALTTLTPLLKHLFTSIDTFNALSAAIVVGLATLPMVASLSADALQVVPSSIRNAGYALGMSKFHVVTRIMVPAAFSGIVASFLLAFARAVGETMAVSIAAGSTPSMSFDYLKSIQTMTAFIVQISMGDTAAGSIEYYTIYAIGISLFVLTFAFNFAATAIIRRFREVYQ
ncbi:MAG TPA: phosphate ABC transporter permease subunit PstC [Leptospiraceae bacterium]|nr:phosphate ABC transporter permease subunit PstC [Leptospirales bacterium]HMU82698.1 phosphate ABC transporter permease subunit PstC [Leptospiraceae bacterium]HMW59727.1 phosphate ABC transporter permease subunit PstC [Leptospiraceae bacterium]HMX57038.1 phosphate ABC transporter permease subunit PstC [Leptospiraceae bacterium]HMY46863.1 phosphate ABC transporter permease subunit PstC [Leptospiraceae bacterium]